jgi:uncharacterized repeat protein (TIGR01451 family)
MKHLLTILFLLVAVLNGTSQGWERIVSGSAQDAGQALTLTADGGYAFTGYFATTRFLLSKADIDGKLQWTKNLVSAPSIGAGRQIMATPDQHLIVTGWVRSDFGAASDGFVAKTDDSGNVIWSKTFGTPQGEDQFTDLLLLPNGDLLISGYYSQPNGIEDFWFVRLDSNGNLLDDQTYGQADRDEKANAISLLPSGHVILAGEVSNGIDKDVFVVRIDPSGTLIWGSEYGFDFVPNAFSSDRALDMAIANDGHIILCGVTNATTTSGGGGLILKINADGNPQPIWFSAQPSTPFFGMQKAANGYLFTGLKEISNTFEDLLILKTDEAGAKIWERTSGRGGSDKGENILVTPDGGTIAIGSTSTSISSFDSYAYLVKTDASGRIYTNIIEGFIFQDLNNNCIKDANEQPLVDWIATIESPDLTRYAATDANGYFSVTVDTGAHTVALLPSSALWQPCQDEYPVYFSAPLDSTQVFIPVQAAIICPRNEIDIQTPVLRQCADNVYQVRYCNSGTFPSPNTEVEITLDPALSYTSSSIVPTNINGNTLRFNLGYVDNGQCGNFSLTAFLRCDSIEIGQAHCVNAHIFPDTICTVGSNWDGAIIRASGKCVNGQVELNLKNTGKGNMGNNQDFIVIEDLIMIQTPTSFKLDAGQDSLVYMTPATGKTYRVIAGQSPGYPGESYPSAAVEGCKTDSITQISLGYFTMFPEDDADQFLSSSCLESFSTNQSIAPFFKSGHPKGYDLSHFIQPENDLTYVIRFENTSTDTIGAVIVRDTLSVHLDPSTVYPGASSHPYQFEVYGNGIVQFSIPNADLLPDGSASETRSSGFVSFRVAQRPNLPCETEILNRAAVFFDYNAPENTNQVFHTVCDRDTFITVSTGQPLLPNTQVHIYPNPFTDWAIFDLQNIPAQVYTLELYDTQGRLLVTNFYDHPTFRLFRSQIPAGILFYRLAADGRPVFSGTLIKG